jgi:Rieske Fe-S protein
MSKDAMSRRSVIGGCVITVAAGITGYLVAHDKWSAKANGTATSSTPNYNGQFLAHLSQVPGGGGGLILAQDKVVLVRGEGGTVHGLSAICTHQGCTVGSIHNGTITCPCHGSEFNAQTGAVIQGPATRPLPAVSVVVRGQSVFTA